MKQLLLESMYFSLLSYLYSRQHTLPLEKEIHKLLAPSHILGIERLSWRWSKSNNWISIWMKVRKVRKFESASETWASANNDAIPRDQEPRNRSSSSYSRHCWTVDGPIPSIKRVEKVEESKKVCEFNLDAKSTIPNKNWHLRIEKMKSWENE